MRRHREEGSHEGDDGAARRHRGELGGWQRDGGAAELDRGKVGQALSAHRWEGAMEVERKDVRTHQRPKMGAGRGSRVVADCLDG